ncbi:hypothetical protein [Listeria booriae]|uniref:Uncharacterized protein n=1 Tax=Listeria booriae TaxID=1552123 RepID=A0A7X0XTT4_9LIST|nr:hypothetical protein [Listeria booriae]MBC1228595.1 hypothetical protein [Listeria booriae]MBC1780578.1 hypothetical protein [Listeria booriae]MBC1914236.1 hypothetical protein [Listeria booriae]MBC2069317.1 hypothetical protein [Listeria booriae]
MERQIRELDQAIAKAFETGASSLAYALQADKKEIERARQKTQMQQQLRKQTDRIAEENWQQLQRFTASFEGWQHTMQKLERNLSDSFESQTGKAIVEKLVQERRRLCQEYGSDLDQVIRSCRLH